MAEAVTRLGRALVGLSDYELQQLENVREHRERELRRSPRRLVPESVKDKGREWYDKALKTPGAAREGGRSTVGEGREHCADGDRSLHQLIAVLARFPVARDKTCARAVC